MGLIKKAAKAGAKAAGKKIVKAANGNCPGSSNGRHSYKTEMIGKTKAKTKKVKGQVIVIEEANPGSPVTYCHNAGCGRVS